MVGPTGSGKSDLALAIAEEFNGEVVNCDSLQVFRYFDIGTAKLPSTERRGIPHHLIDIVDPDELFTAGEYARLARETHRRTSRPAAASRSSPAAPDSTSGRCSTACSKAPPATSRCATGWRRARLGAPGSLHRLLDPLRPGSGARKIHPNDVPKVTRALEVCLLTRRPGDRTVPRPGATRSAAIAH